MEPTTYTVSGVTLLEVTVDDTGVERVVLAVGDPASAAESWPTRVTVPTACVSGPGWPVAPGATDLTVEYNLGDEAAGSSCGYQSVRVLEPPPTVAVPGQRAR